METPACSTLSLSRAVADNAKQPYGTSTPCEDGPGDPARPHRQRTARPHTRPRDLQLCQGVMLPCRTAANRALGPLRSPGWLALCSGRRSEPTHSLSSARLRVCPLRFSACLRRSADDRPATRLGWSASLTAQGSGSRTTTSLSWHPATAARATLPNDGLKSGRSIACWRSSFRRKSSNPADTNDPEAAREDSNRSPKNLSPESRPVGAAVILLLMARAGSAHRSRAGVWGEVPGQGGSAPQRDGREEGRATRTGCRSWRHQVNVSPDPSPRVTSRLGRRQVRARPDAVRRTSPLHVRARTVFRGERLAS